MPEKKTAAPAGASLPDEKPDNAAKRDRSKPRMSEGLRLDLEQRGEAVDPNTGDLFIRETNGETRHVPAAQVAEYRHQAAVRLVHGDHPPEVKQD